LRTLMPHQRQMLNYALKHSSVALFCEMRLGKTLVAIHWAIEQARFRQGRVLVVAPLSVIPTWCEELKLEDVKDSFVLKGRTDQIEELLTSHKRGFFIVNYELLRVRSILGQFEWEAIVLDESTRIRNPQARITRILTQFGKRIPAKAILSGLPAPEGPLDYVSQMLFLFPEFMGAQNYWQFRHRYFVQYVYDWFPKKGALKRIRDEIKERAFTLTRKEAGMGGRKVYEKRYVAMTSPQARQYKKIKKEFSYDLNGKDIDTKWNPVKIGWMAQVAGGFTPDGRRVSTAKMDEIVSLLKGELKNEQVIIWFRRTCELLGTAAYLSERGFKVGHIRGETSFEARVKITREFNNAEIQVLCVQSKCGMYGIDWSVADTAIYYSNYYENEVRMQSEDRIVHPKKLRPVLYIDLITEGTLDEDVVDILKDKSITSKMFMSKLVYSLMTRKQKGE